MKRAEKGSTTGIIVNQGSDGSHPQFADPGGDIFGPMTVHDARKLMEKKGVTPVKGKNLVWTVPFRDGLGRTIDNNIYVFVPLKSPDELSRQIDSFRD